MSRIAVITGFGSGLGKSLATRLVASGDIVVGLSRSGTDLPETDQFHAMACDVTSEDAVAEAFTRIRRDLGHPNVLIHNTASLLLEDFTRISAADFESIWRTSALSGFLCAQAVLPSMLAEEQGVLLFSGATASVKAGPKSGAFSAAKFALRGMAQSLARAYGPRGIHVVHTVIDGVIWGPRAEKKFRMQHEQCMDPDDIAESYTGLINQPRSSWTHECDLRPWQESF